jgi:hypothetical protein
MFAVSKAFSIAESIVAIQTGIAKAAANPWPANLAAMASVAAATSGIISTIASTNPSFEGGGFTGYGSRSGGIDGRGGFAAVLHPNETVIDHTKGGGNVVVNIMTQPDMQVEKNERKGPDGQTMIDVMIKNSFDRLAGTGQLDRTMKSNYGVGRPGRY